MHREVSGVYVIRVVGGLHKGLGCTGGGFKLAGAIGEGGDSGKTAQQISNASFATLSLIYSFTETLNLSDDLATLAGLTARVAFLREVSLLSPSRSKLSE
jgi:hypothetical protein